MAAAIGIATTGVLILGVFYACFKSGRGGVEHAKYTVFRTFNKSPHVSFELRKYDKAVAAKTFIPYASASSDVRRSNSQGFRQVAGYIFGGNANSQSIAMTAPVVSRNIPTESGVELSFILPSSIQSVSDTPQPNSNRVVLEEIPVHFAAVHGFYGDYPSSDKIESIGRKLLQGMKEEKVIPIPCPTGITLEANEPPVNLRVMSYDPPWIPSFLKLNEISIIAGISQMPLENEEK
jgi:hypothetical protein